MYISAQDFFPIGPSWRIMFELHVVGFTCAALPLHGPQEVIGSLLAVQGFQQVKHIVIKHQVDQVEGSCM